MEIRTAASAVDPRVRSLVKRRQVLVIDAPEAIGALSRDALELRGYEVTLASWGAETSKLLAADFEGVVLVARPGETPAGPDTGATWSDSGAFARFLQVVSPDALLGGAVAPPAWAYDVLVSDGSFASRLPVAVRNALEDLEKSRRLRSLDRSTRREAELFAGFVGRSDAICDVLDSLLHVLNLRGSVLLRGEPGTGKARLARTIHDASSQASGPFVSLHCVGMTEAQIERALFGQERGGLTGAPAVRPGRLELAHGGTIFLAGVEELPLHTQAKLLRVLESGSLVRQGGQSAVDIDARIIAGTERDLSAMVADGSFRDDLYYRLAVFPVELPRLVDRAGDIALLAHHFMRAVSLEQDKTLDGFSRAALEALEAHGYPGNVRELENIIGRAVVLATGSQLTLRDLPRALVERASGHEAPSSSVGERLLDEAFERLFRTPEHLLRAEELEEALIQRGLQLLDGNVTELARRIGLSRATLYRRIRALEGDGPQED